MELTEGFLRSRTCFVWNRGAGCFFAGPDCLKALLLALFVWLCTYETSNIVTLMCENRRLQDSTKALIPGWNDEYIGMADGDLLS